MSLLDDLEELEIATEPKTREEIVRVPFAYPGSKSKSVAKIISLLPYRAGYVEPFGGSGAVLLARHSSKLEVFNDRYAGVVAFYRCIVDAEKLEQLIVRIEHTVHSREDFMWSRDSWNRDTLSDVERAARWYYMLHYSFGRLGRNFGRSVSSKALLISIRDRIPLFYPVHNRLKRVQIENLDWLQCVNDFDDYDHVFYMDPPYLEAHRGTYDHELSVDQHKKLLDTIFQMKGYVALSGYANPTYDARDWDERHEWDVHISIKAKAYTESNNKSHLKDIDESNKATEVLWIKGH